MSLPIDPAQCVLLAHCAEAMFAPDVLTPELDERVTGQWKLVAHITGANALFGAQRIGLGDRVYYGYVAKSMSQPDLYIAVIRGTEQPIEWLEDCEALLVQTRLGWAEHGFWSIYQSLQIDGKPIAAALKALLPDPSRVVVIGHSLGSALASYLLSDMADSDVIRSQDASNATSRVQGYGAFFASPKPGDPQFGAHLNRNVGHWNYTVWNYLRDVVPRLPLSLPVRLGFLGFETLQHVEVIRPSDSTAQIPDDIKSNHSALSYYALLSNLKTGVPA